MQILKNCFRMRHLNVPAFLRNVVVTLISSTRGHVCVLIPSQLFYPWKSAPLTVEGLESMIAFKIIGIL